MTNLIYLFLLISPFFGLSQGAIKASFFDDLIKKHNIPGMSIAIVEGDKLLYSGVHGIKATDSNEPLDKQTIFAAASLSKPVFAYAVMQLVESGKLELDKPLCKYLEYEDIAHDERYKKITARMLLSHSGGFPNWRRGQLDLLFNPGERFQYSGEGYVYLMRVIEHITQKSLDDFMKEMAFQPLGMTNTSYIWKERFEENFAAPHDDLGYALSKFKPKEGNTAHSLQTTAEDFATFLLALLNQKNISPSTMKKILEPQVKVGDSGKLHWGLGWGHQETKKGKAIWQWGDNGTYRAFVIAYPGSKKGLVYFTNSNNGLRIVPELVEYIFQDECPAWEWLSYDKEDTPRLNLLKAILEKSYNEAIKPYLDPNQLHQDTTKIKQWDMNNIGYRLMNLQRYEDAKKVFYANMQAFPKSANTYDSYAEASLRNGEMEIAKKYYVKALNLNPENKTAQSIVHQLSVDSQKGNVVFRLNDYPHARLVTVAGSFNDWNWISIPLTRKNGQWSCKLDLSPGTYEYKFVIDGIWTIDPENTQVKESNGSINSVLVVE